MLDRTRQAVFRFNVAQRGDALELLRSLPDRNASVALFNPQHRSVLDHLKFGNDLGIDPDLSGTLAIVETINGVPALIDAIDMPSTGTGAKARVDIIAAAQWIAKLAPSTAYVERAQAFPGQGASADSPTAGPSAPSRRTIALCSDSRRSWSRLRAGSAGSISPAKIKKRPDRRRCSCSPRNTPCSRGRKITDAPRLR